MLDRLSLLVVYGISDVMIFSADLVRAFPCNAAGIIATKFNTERARYARLIPELKSSPLICVAVVEESEERIVLIV